MLENESNPESAEVQPTPVKAKETLAVSEKPETQPTLNAAEKSMEQPAGVASEIKTAEEPAKTAEPVEPAVPVEATEPVEVIAENAEAKTAVTEADVADVTESADTTETVEKAQMSLPLATAQCVSEKLEAEQKAPEKQKPAEQKVAASKAPEHNAPKHEVPGHSAPKHSAPKHDAPEQGKQDKQPESGEIGFSDLGLLPEVVKAVAKSGYETPTPIQAEIIPYLLDGRDILAQSQTGTGKTAAFALPVLSRLQKSKQRSPQVLVLAPTRELAIQVAKSFATYGADINGFAVAAIYGGQPYEPQLKQLRRGVQVVVGTPGRVIDHVNRGTLDLSQLKCLVLDEADEMLNMGFLDDVEFVLEKTPDETQVALFSATLPAAIRKISGKYLKDPAKVTIKKKTMTAESIRQRAVFASQRNKVDMLIRFLEAEDTDGVIVFTRTRESTTTVAEQLVKSGFSAVALNGEVAQKTRERTIERLKSGNVNVLVATDVAARGLDVQRISHVFNFDLPEGPESYIHRVGRTGRAGRKGEAIIFLTKTQRGKLKWIERETGQPIEIVEGPSLEEANQNRITMFKREIGETIANADLEFYSKILAEYASESEQPFEVIAAAIAHMKKDSAEFLMKKVARQTRDRDRDRGDDRDFGGRGDRGRRDRQMRAPESGMKRYRLGIGKRDGVRVGAIVGAIANEGGIDGREIGQIMIHQSYTIIDLPERLSDGVVRKLQRTRVNGRPMNIAPARESDGGSAGNRGGGGFRKKRRGNEQGSFSRDRKFKPRRKRDEGGSGGSGGGGGGYARSKRKSSSAGDSKRRTKR